MNIKMETPPSPPPPPRRQEPQESQQPQRPQQPQEPQQQPEQQQPEQQQKPQDQQDQQEEQGDPAARPIHYLEHVRVGNNGTQLLVSTQDHVYNARDVETGENCWQVIGTWTDQSVQELSAMLNNRSATRGGEGGGGNAAQVKGFGTSYGTGRKIGWT